MNGEKEDIKRIADALERIADFLEGLAKDKDALEFYVRADVSVPEA